MGSELIVDIIFNFLFFCIMISMGTTISVETLKERFRHPKGIAVAWFHQFLILPFLAFLISKILDLNSIYSVALKIQAMCPGGATSNVLSFVAIADIPLSIACTSLSTLSALVMMPVWMAVYLPNEDSIDFADTLPSIFLGLGIVLGGTAVGMYLNVYHAVAADRINRAAGPFMLVMIAIVLGGSAASGNNPFTPEQPAETFISVLFIPGFALVSSLVVSSLINIPKPQRIAIAFETSCQNTPLCIALLYQIYSGDDRDKAVIIPILYSFASGFFNFFTLTWGYRNGWTYADRSKSYIENLKETRKLMQGGPENISQALANDDKMSLEPTNIDTYDSTVEVPEQRED